MSNTGKDSLFASKTDSIGEFVFDESVASVFDDMIRRSVPGYAMTLSLMSLIAKRYAQPDSRIYDLGCSLGAGIVALADELSAPVSFVGVDNSAEMLERCRRNTKGIVSQNTLELRCEDVLSTPIENASIVVLNFTLQFIEKKQRPRLLRHIANGLKPGGVLLLSEKIHLKDERMQKELFELHHDFKRSQGYSDLEISQKRAALENVLIPESIETHKDRLTTAGFSCCETWLQCFNFASLLAIK